MNQDSEQTRSTDMDKHVGQEPSWRGMLEVSDLDLTRALNWYANNRTRDDSVNYFIKKYPDITKAASDVIGNAGFLVRMINRGAPLDIRAINHLSARQKECRRLTEANNTPTTAPCYVSGIAINRDELLDEVIGRINVAVDTVLLSGKVLLPIIPVELKSNQRKEVLRFTKNFVKQIEADAICTEEPQFKNTREVNSIMKVLKGVLSSLENSSVVHTKIRKTVTPEKAVMQFMCKLKDGLSKVKLIGAKAVLAYDENTRKVILFEGDTIGLSVKGKAFVNVSGTSQCKILRKPDTQLKEFEGLGHKQVATLIEAIGTAQQKPRTRGTPDLLILNIWR